MSIRLAAKLMDEAAHDLSQRGRGVFGHRERHAHVVIGDFIVEAWEVPPGGVLPAEVRESIEAHIESTIEALETHVTRSGSRSASRTIHDSGVVREIYALREAQQHLMQATHLPACWARPIVNARSH